MKFFIKKGVTFVQKDSKGRTALHEAVWGIEGGREGKKKGSIMIEDSPEIA